MHLHHECPECGEQEAIDVKITVYLWSNNEPHWLIFTYTCCRCRHEWVQQTDDFITDEDP